MDISDIRRRLSEVDQNIGVEPINNTFNSIDIAGGEDTDDEGASADITIKNVGRKFCPSPSTVCPDWQASYINGRFATVRNPRKRVSVLPPTRGCGTLSKVSKTSRDRGTALHSSYADAHQRNKVTGCRISINAGFFMRHVRVNGTELRCNSTLRNCDCLGNLISDGKYIQTSKAINANFGIREGKFIIGYVSENEVLHNKNDKKFDQLVSGVIWLVRNGTNFVLESASIETARTQQTSKHLMENNQRSFVDTFAARTVVGYDKKGQLLIYQVDGLHGRAYVPSGLKRGIDLVSLADMLIDLGFVEAINLDGGGSSAFILNDKLQSYPSDECGKHFVCERPVTSIICVHDDIVGSKTSQASTSACTDHIVPRVDVALSIVVGILSAIVFSLCAPYIFSRFSNHNKALEVYDMVFQCVPSKIFSICRRRGNRYTNIDVFEDGFDSTEDDVSQPHDSPGKSSTFRQKTKINRNVVAVDISELEIEIPSLERTPKNSPRPSIDKTSVESPDPAKE
eukprot:g4901.t1